MSISCEFQTWHGKITHLYIDDFPINTAFLDHSSHVWIMLGYRRVLHLGRTCGFSHDFWHPFGPPKFHRVCLIRRLLFQHVSTIMFMAITPVLCAAVCHFWWLNPPTCPMVKLTSNVPMWLVAAFVHPLKMVLQMFNLHCWRTIFVRETSNFSKRKQVRPRAPSLIAALSIFQSLGGDARQNERNPPER